MMRLLLCALLCFAPSLDAAKKVKARPRPAARHAAPKPAPVADVELLSWAEAPFTDWASHGVLLRRQPAGLLAWRLRSAFAFGSQAAQPHPAKDLFDVRLQWKVEGEAAPRAFDAVTLKSGSRWAQESAEEGGLKAESVLLYSATDAVVAATSVTNIGRKPLRVRPWLRISHEEQAGFKALLEASPRYPALWMGLDRGALAGRPLKEWAGVWMGAQSLTLQADGPGTEPRALTKGASLAQDGRLGVTFSWATPQVLSPGQTLRLPVMLVWGTDKGAVQTLGQKEWARSALPKGKAWAEAQKRWAATRSRLPQAAEARWQPLALRAAQALLMSEYAPRGGLNAALFSADKGRRDAFYGVDSALAALAWSDLDHQKAEDSLLELSSFAAAAAFPVPPYTGEEKLAWEAGGLPLHGLAAWELYHRDPDANRAGRFLAAFGPRLRNECAWWPGARDGDGNGLYAFARDDEKPAIFLAGPAAPAPSTGTPTLQNYSVALTSLVAWQMQAASAMAQAAGQAKEADEWLALSDKSRAALAAQAWQGQNYGPGMEAAWPFILGLDQDEGRAQLALSSSTLSGSWAPWQAYYWIRGLAAQGFLTESRQIRQKVLEEIDKRRIFDDIFAAGGNLNVSTAAVALELALERQEQEIFLQSKTAEFEARWLQFRTLDGSFYMKRLRLPEKKASYAKIKIETPKHGPILSENAFIFSCEQAGAFQIQSEKSLTVTNLARPGSPIFKGSHRIELLVPAKARYLVEISR
jgi:hypothetical protein